MPRAPFTDPLPGEPNSATLGSLSNAREVIFYCMAPGCSEKQIAAGRHASVHVTPAEAVERWGADATLAEIVYRMRCTVCGVRGQSKVDFLFPTPKMGLGKDGWG